MKTMIIKPLAALGLVLVLTGCQAGQPKITDTLGRKSPGGLKTSTKQNLAMAGGTAVSGPIKVKFSMGAVGGASSAQVAVSSGTYKVRAATTGVLREE